MKGRKRKTAGRPDLYNEETAREICETIAQSSRGLIHHCKETPHWPDRSTVYNWVLRYPEFGEMYKRAKLLQADLYAEQIIDISDESKGQSKEIVAASRLMVDSRKWIACKLAPKIYGDKVEQKLEVSVELQEAEQSIRDARESYKKER